MNHIVIKVLCIVAALFAITGFSNAAEKTCKGVVSDLTKRQLSGIASCSKSMTFKNGKDKAQKTNCVLRCVMINEGLLSKDGTLSNETFDAFLAKEFPGALTDVAGPKFRKCKDEETSGLDPSPADEFCKSYDGFIKCLLGAMGILCK